MSIQSATPISAVRSDVVIPVTVARLGPQLSRLPAELLLHIFKILATTMFPPTSRFNEVIRPQIFRILNHHYAINRIRSVCTEFASLFMEAFYENFHFSFIHASLINLATDYLTSFPAPLPRLHFRTHLRSICIDIVLENYYFTPQSDLTIPRTSGASRQSRRISSVDEMLTFCPSARLLLDLTQRERGFCNLRLLDLRIRADFRFFPVDDAYLRVLEETNFVVRARKVLLAVTDHCDFETEKHEEVKKRIVVVQ